MSLELLLDSADPERWEEWIPSGIFTGITTNPTLLRQAGQPCEFSNLRQLAHRADRLRSKELHLQAWGNNAQKLIYCGLKLSELTTPSLKIYIKVPITRIGTEAAKELISKNISITFTACYEIQQVLIASALGASYIAPYLGRINDNSVDGLKTVSSMQKAIDNINSNCKILVASIRKKDDINNLVYEGLSTFTIGPELIEEFFNVLPTIEAAKNFENDSNA